MSTQGRQNIVCDTLEPGVRIVRFMRPDLRNQLYDQGAITDCSLYRELHETALTNLSTGDAVVLNFGLIDWFPTAFYRLLLKVRESVQARGSVLFLCCLTPNIRECFDIMGGGKLFEIRATEANTLSVVKQLKESGQNKPKV